MTRFAALSLAAVLVAAPAGAQSGNDDMREGMDLLSEGTQLLLRGLMREFEPALRDLEGVLDELNAYHPPEILPNGDIIIRRKVPLEPEVGEDGEVEL